MNCERDTIIRISPAASEIVVEQPGNEGAILHKSLTPETFAKCILGSRIDESFHFSGILPENCIAVLMGNERLWYFIRFPERYTDLSYYGTLYEHFPIPRLVFSFGYDVESRKVTSRRLCVVKDERLTMETPTYQYPFSNVHKNASICIGNNELPVYKDPARIFTLADYILRMPNNNDVFSEKNNRLGLGYRDLLEHLKDKPPAYYYTDVLIPDRKTLRDFFNGR